MMSEKGKFKFETYKTNKILIGLKKYFILNSDKI